jgi:tripartite-type tricarboxylate transporter receptor subunit TctC
MPRRRNRRDVPTIGEFVPGPALDSWAGMGAPSNTSADVIERLKKEINAGSAAAGIKAKYADLGTLLAISPAEFRKLIAEDIEKWANVIKFAGIKAE